VTVAALDTPLPATQPPRWCTRGSKAVVVRPGADGSAIGVHHVTFLRAPLLGLDVPNRLDGAFRSHMPNSLKAKNDLQASTRWLSSYEERPATQW
jgi:hypothetical protein